MMPPNSTIISAFSRLGVLVLSLTLVSCSARDLSKLRLPSNSSQLKKEQAQKPIIREVTIPLEKAQPGKLPEALTETQPALDLKKQGPKGMRFTISARGVDIKNVLFALSQEIEQNIVIAPGVNKQATADLKSVTLAEVLDILLPPLHLEYEVDGNLIRVQREKMRTRTFFLNYITSTREGSSILKSSSGTSGTSTTSRSPSSGESDANSRSTSSVQSSESTDIWTDILSGLQSIVTPSASTQDNSSMLASSDTSGSSEPENSSEAVQPG